MAEAEKVTTLSKAKLHFGRLVEAEHASRKWRATVPSGVTVEDVLRPTFWSHYTKNLKPGDDIDVVCEDATWRAILWVMFVGTTEVKTEVFIHKEFGLLAGVTSMSDDYDVVWKGPVLNYAIINKANGEIVKDKLMPKSEAFNYLRKYLSTMKA